MELQKVFKHSYMDELERNIRVFDYLGDEFPFDESKVKTLANVYKPEGLLDKLNPNNDFISAKEIYQAYENITPLLASVPDLWVYLAHADLFGYVQKRWPIPDGFSEGEAVNHITNHWFKTDSIRASLSGLWWSVYLSIDNTRDNKYELTEVLFSNETFRSRVFGSSLLIRHKDAAMGILEFILENKEKFIGFETKGRDVARHFNQLGAYKVLSALDKDFFKMEMEKLTVNW